MLILVTLLDKKGSGAPGLADLCLCYALPETRAFVLEVNERVRGPENASRLGNVFMSDYKR